MIYHSDTALETFFGPHLVVPFTVPTQVHSQDPLLEKQEQPFEPVQLQLHCPEVQDAESANSGD